MNRIRNVLIALLIYIIQPPLSALPRADLEAVLNYVHNMKQLNGVGEQGNFESLQRSSKSSQDDHEDNSMNSVHIDNANNMILQVRQKNINGGGAHQAHHDEVDNQNICGELDPEDCLIPDVAGNCKDLCTVVTEEPPLCNALDSTKYCSKPSIASLCKKLCSVYVACGKLGAPWFAMGSECFLLVQELKNWDDAQAHCNNLNANLAQPSDVHAMSDYLFSLWFPNGTTLDKVKESAKCNEFSECPYNFPPFIGGQEANVGTGDYVWSNNTSVNSSIIFDPKNPSENRNNRRCLVVAVTFKAYKEKFGVIGPLSGADCTEGLFMRGLTQSLCELGTTQ